MRLQFHPRMFSLIAALAAGVAISPYLQAASAALPQLPGDLVGAVGTTDPGAADWLAAWEGNRPADADSLKKLDGILSTTNVSAATLCRVARQLDRCRDRPAAQYWAAAAIRQASSELDAGLRPNASLAKSLAQLQPLLAGSMAHQQAIEAWATLVLRLPPQFIKTYDLRKKSAEAMTEAKLYQSYLASSAAAKPLPPGAVNMPEDLLALVAGQDAELLQWINAWQMNRDAWKVGILCPHDGLSRLDNILGRTRLSAMTLARVARQFDRGRDWYAESHTEMAAVRVAHAELKAGYIPDASFAQMLWRFYPTLQEAGGRRALDSWAEIILSLPPKLINENMIATARVAQVYGCILQNDYGSADKIASSLEFDLHDNPRLLTPVVQSQLFTLIARIRENGPSPSQALNYYMAAIRFDPTNAESSRRAICLLASLGEKEKSLRLAADYIKRFNLMSPELKPELNDLYLDIDRALKRGQAG